MAKISRRSVASNSSPADSNANSIPSPTNDSGAISNKSNTKPKSSSTNSSSSSSSTSGIPLSPSRPTIQNASGGSSEYASNDNSFPDPLRSNGSQFTTRTIPNGRHNNTHYGHSSTIHQISSHSSNRSPDKINTNNRNSTIPLSSTTTTPTPPPIIIPHSNLSGYNITQAQILAAERERIRAEFFATYDVMTGVRIAATLGGFFGLMVFLIVWKSRSHSNETLRVLKDPKIAAVAVACMQEEEERKIQEAMEATGMSIYPDEYDAILYRRQRMLSLGNVSAPPVLHRGYRFSSVGGGGYSSLLEPPRRYSYSYGGGGRRKSGSESSRILSNYPMGSSFGTDDYFVETDDEIENPEFEEHHSRADSVKRHGFLEVPNAAAESRRSSAMTCCSTESSYLERRCSALTLGLGNLPPSLRRKLSTASRTSSNDLWDYYYPDIQVIQPTPSPSPCPSERNLYDQATSSRRPTTAANAASIIKTAISSSTAAITQAPIATTITTATTVNIPSPAPVPAPPPLVRKHSIAYYDPESAQSGRQQHIHSISADTADFLPYPGTGKAVQLQEKYDDSSELKLIVKRKISAPESTTNGGRIIDNNNSYTYSTEFVTPAGGTNSIGSLGSTADLSKNITTHAAPKRAPLASLSSFKISSLEYQDSEMRSLDEDSVFLDSIADTDEDMEQFSTDSDEISLEDDAIEDKAMKTPTLQTVVSPLQSNQNQSNYNQEDRQSIKSIPPLPQHPDIRRVSSTVGSFKRPRRPVLQRHRSISTATSSERITLIDHQMKDFSQQQSFDSTDRGPPLETHFTILPRQDTNESTPSSQRRLQMKPLLQQQISAEQTTDEATTNTTTTTAETCSTFNTEIPQGGQQCYTGFDDQINTTHTQQHSVHLPLITVPASLKNLIRHNSPPACSSVILELPLIKLPTTDESSDNSVLDNNDDDDDKSRSKSDDSRDPSLPGSSRKWSKETLF